MTLTALVPMKGHSERVPGKNLRSIASRPLFEWILAALAESHLVDRIVVDTDAEEIASRVVASFPDVDVVMRPPSLQGDLVPMHDIVAHLASTLDGDEFLQTHSTNPLLRAETIDTAIEAFRAGEGHDSLMGVTARHARYFWPDGRPINHDPAVLLRTQDLPPVYEENSNLYIASREVIAATGRRIGTNPLLFPIDAIEAWDIDEESDFLMAEILLAERIR